jgi:hypothetical protein
MLLCESLCIVRDLFNNSGTFKEPYSESRRGSQGVIGKVRWQLSQELIHHADLGALKPSMLMAKMLALLHEAKSLLSFSLKLFLRKLPTAWHEHLAV